MSSINLNNYITDKTYFTNSHLPPIQNTCNRQVLADQARLSKPTLRKLVDRHPQFT